MEPSRQLFLPDARFASDEHSRVGGRDARGQRHHATHRSAGSAERVWQVRSRWVDALAEDLESSRHEARHVEGIVRGHASRAPMAPESDERRPAGQGKPLVPDAKIMTVGRTRTRFEQFPTNATRTKTLRVVGFQPGKTVSARRTTRALDASRVGTKYPHTIMLSR